MHRLPLSDEMTRQMLAHMNISEDTYYKGQCEGIFCEMELAIEIGAEEYSCYAQFDRRPENIPSHATAAIDEFRIKRKSQHIPRRLENR